MREESQVEDSVEHFFVGGRADEGEGDASGAEDLFCGGEDFGGGDGADFFVDGLGVYDVAVDEDGAAEAHVLAGGALEGHAAGADGIFFGALEFRGADRFCGERVEFREDEAERLLEVFFVESDRDV